MVTWRKYNEGNQVNIEIVTTDIMAIHINTGKIFQQAVTIVSIAEYFESKKTPTSSHHCLSRSLGVGGWKFAFFTIALPSGCFRRLFH